MAKTLGELADLVGGTLCGDGSIPISGADIIRDAGPGDITLAEHPRLAAQLANSPAAAVLTPPGFEPDGIPYIVVESVPTAFARIVQCFRPQRECDEAGIRAGASISATARLGGGVVVYAGCTICDGVEIGDRVVVHAGVRILPGCRIGDDTVLYPNAVLYENTIVGARCRIHGGAVIGAHGFGYSMVEGRHRLSAQLGSVVIGDDVEIGACATIDRGTYGATVIGEGTKIDNQVMIAHNCRIGRHNLICSQVGIAGSTTTGDYVVMAGQVGVRDHVHIGQGSVLGAKAGVMHDIPEGVSYVGIPATPERQQMLIQAAIMKLPELKKQLRALQRAVDELAGRCEQRTAPEAA